MPLPIAFCNITGPSQLVFSTLLEGTETRDIREEPVWVKPRMVRHTRFPMAGGKHPVLAAKAVWKAYQEDPSQYLLVFWYWNTASREPEIRLRFFRNPSESIWQYGDTLQPDWYQQADEENRAKVPTRWDRIAKEDS